MLQKRVVGTNALAHILLPSCLVFSDIAGSKQNNNNNNNKDAKQDVKEEAKQQQPKPANSQQQQSLQQAGRLRTIEIGNISEDSEYFF